MGDDVSLSSNIQELLKKKGATYVLTHVARTTNRTTDVTTATTTTENVVGVAFTYSGNTSGDSLLTTDLVNLRMKKMFIAGKGLTFPPKIGDTVLMDGFNWIVKASTAVSLSGLVLYHKMIISHG